MKCRICNEEEGLDELWDQCKKCFDKSVKEIEIENKKLRELEHGKS